MGDSGLEPSSSGGEQAERELPEDRGDGLLGILVRVVNRDRSAPLGITLWKAVDGTDEHGNPTPEPGPWRAASDPPPAPPAEVSGSSSRPA